MAKKHTERQKKLIKLFSVNLGNKKPKSTYEMLLEAGYSEKSAKQQSATLEGVREKLKPLVEKLEKERDEIIEQLKKKRSKAKYAELIKGIDIMIKNIQLLGGKPTEIINISDQKQKDIDNALKDFES